MTDPLQDTAPIPFDQLLPEQRRLIKQINALLRSIKFDAKEVPAVAPGPYPWPRLIQDRRHRVIMLDGPRGSGKTSILLTLLYGWQRDALVANDRTTVEKDLFKDMGNAVRPLAVLDFNPLPPEVHPYPWLVQALGPLVTALDDGTARAKSSWDSLESSPRSLREQWRRLHRSAELGWRRHQRPRQDIDQEAADALEQHSQWMQLERDWRLFIDELLKEAEVRGLVPPGALLVLPVDDLDLHPTISDDLLLAIRKVWHPRVVTLLAGSRPALGRAIARELRKRRFQSGLSSNALTSNERRLTEGLAEDLLNKVVPEASVVGVPLLTIGQALELVSGFRMDQWPLPDGHKERSVVELLLAELRPLLRTDDRPLIRARDVLNRSVDGKQELKTLLLRVLAQCWDRKFEGHLFNTDPAWQWVPRASSDAIYYWMSYVPSTSKEAKRPGQLHHRIVVAAGNSPSTMVQRKLVSGRLRRDPDEVGRLEPVPFPLNLRLLLGVGATDAIEGFEQLDSDCTMMIQSECTLGSGLSLKLPFPFPGPNRSCLGRTAILRRWCEVVPLDNIRDVDTALWWWIWFHAGEAMDAPQSGSGAPHEEPPFPTAKHWDLLLKHLKVVLGDSTAHQSPGFASWALRSVPVLAAPEYGLSAPLQVRLLTWLRGMERTSSWATVCTQLDGIRGSLLERSVDFFSDIDADAIWESEQRSRAKGQQDVEIVDAEIRLDFPEAHWWGKSNVGGVTDFLSMKVLDGPRIVDVLRGRRIPMVREPSTENGRNFGEVFLNLQSGEQGNWSALAFGPALKNDAVAAAITENAILLQDEVIAPADFMARTWAALADALFHPADVDAAGERSRWIATPDSRRLEYTGTTLCVRTSDHYRSRVGRFELVACDGWSVDSDFLSDLDADVRKIAAAWILLCQSFSVGYGDGFESLMIENRPQLILDDLKLEAPSVKPWHNREFNRDKWRTICQTVSRRQQHGNDGALHPQESWVLANWLVLGWDTITRDSPSSLLKYPFDGKDLHRRVVHTHSDYVQEAMQWVGRDDIVEVVEQVFDSEDRHWLTTALEKKKEEVGQS